MKVLATILPLLSVASAVPLSGSLASCPGQLTGTILAPTLTVPVSKANPNKSYGNSHNYTVTTPNDMGTVQNFHLPLAALGKTCSLYFSLPSKAQSPGNTGYTYSGEGHFQLNDFLYAPNDQVTYNTLPPQLMNLGTYRFVPGNFYLVSSIPCPVGDISGSMFSNDTTFEFYQTDGQGFVNGGGSGGCPLGLFTTYA